jgi:hypothetical protein
MSVGYFDAADLDSFDSQINPWTTMSTVFLKMGMGE